MLAMVRALLCDMRKSAIIGCGVLVATAIVVLLAYRVLWSYKAVWQPGSIIVLASPEEAWFFVQMNLMVDRGGGEHPVIHLAQSLEVLVVDKKGLRDRRSQADCQFDINPGLSTLWRSENAFMLYEHPNYYSRTPGVHRIWSNDKFRLASSSETASKECRVVIDANDREREQRAKAETKHAGWDTLLDTTWRDWDGAPVVWGDSAYTLRFTQSNNGRMNLELTYGQVKAAQGQSRTDKIVVPFEYSCRPRRMSIFEYRRLGGR
jgi:hypothetical protein